MKTRNLRCASLGILITGAFSLFTLAQEAKPIVRKPGRPISSRSRVARKTTQPKRVRVDQNRVHRFDELFDEPGQAAVSTAPQPKVTRQSYTPGRFPGIQTNGTQPIAQTSTGTQAALHNEGMSNPFVDGTGTADDEVWQLSEVEPMMANTATGDVFLGRANLEQTPAATSRLNQVTTANGDRAASEPVRTVAEEREFARWKKAPSNSFENHGDGWVSGNTRSRVEEPTRSAAIETVQPVIREPKKLVRFRRGLLRPQQQVLNRPRPFTQRPSRTTSQDSHWASADKFRLTEPLESTGAKKLVPVPTRRVSRSREVQNNSIDDSWYDDFPDSKARSEAPARSISFRRPLQARPISSRRSASQKAKTP